jgi:subtilase family serine protease
MNTILARSLVTLVFGVIAVLAAACAAPTDESTDDGIRVSAPSASEHPSFYYQIHLPNLQISSISSPGCAGGTARITVYNAGNAGSPATTVLIQSPTLATQTTVPPIAAGASVTVSLAYRGSGGGTISAMVDPNNTVSESNESDNGLWICVG